ncbi:Arrestin (or S-antigen) N-terminal domain-containing protein [Elsinoe fawcettii]|nr:Arrestin (or S-antigen) N-terminal domain-containing protein [Elsinoe fawcettii]
MPVSILIAPNVGSLDYTATPRLLSRGPSDDDIAPYPTPPILTTAQATVGGEGPRGTVRNAQLLSTVPNLVPHVENHQLSTMQQASSPTTATLQSPTVRKSLFTRISSPFGGKSRTVAEFTVQADDPHRRYAPGDVVKGNVILKLVKAVRVTHIVVCLHGFAQVYKTPGAPPPEGFRAHNNLIGKGRGKRRGEYFGNGFATLFEDERVVCGDGRLEEGNYKFEFKMRFPDETLPSSIDFERGTVTYMVTATMTRPNSMAPMVYHDQKIQFAERIDVSKLLPPKPRMITLEPLLKRSTAKSTTSRRRTGQSDSIRQDDGSGSQYADGHSAARSQASTTGEYIITARSPSPSIRSMGSRHSSSNRHTSDSVRSSRASDSGSALHDHSSGSRRNQTITVHVESLRGGTLRGDTIPLRIVINHTKHVKSMQGVVVTLYRQARVDTHPALPLGPTTDGEKRKFEDYYPRSLTGLGGLSLSAAGSSHIFRKDLSQIVMPLLVDPHTLTTELNPKLRVPEDSFPTIACVPGAMISFKYYLEVILDIQGKLAGSDKYFTQANTENAMSTPIDVDTSGSDRWGPHPYVDTTAIRRDKSVVTCILEIVIGTHDSERKKGKERVPADVDLREPNVSGGPSSPFPADHPMRYPGDPPPLTTAQTWPNNRNQHYDAGTNGEYNYNYDYYNEGYDPNYDYSSQQWYDYDAPPDFAPPEFEPPALPDDHSLSEKERARRAEARLLPSQPPPVSSSETAATASLPSAPSLDLDFGLGSFMNDASPPSPYLPSGAVSQPGPSAPRYSQIGLTVATGSSTPRSPASLQVATDDKDELQRRELERRASRPPPVPAKDTPPVSPQAVRVNGNGTRRGYQDGSRPPDVQGQQQQSYTPLVPSSSELDELELRETGAEAQEGQAASGANGGELPRYER